MPCNCQNCKLDTDALLDKVRALLNARLAAQFTRGLRHDNHDAIFSPAQWDYDRARTERHSLGTSCSMTFNPSTSTLSIHLTYSVN